MEKVTKEKIETKIILLFKLIRFAVSCRQEHTTPVFIMGYGRSGSSMLLRVFERDLHVKTYTENHPSVAQNFMLNYDRLYNTICRAKTKIVVFKPILNSFEAAKLLSEYPTGLVVWLIRDYQDVVASGLKKFGTKVGNYMKEYIETGLGDNWISKTMPSATKKKIAQFIKGVELQEQDWMALVWWAVNYTIISEKLVEKNNIIFVRYEELVSNPDKVLKKIYNNIGLSYKKTLGKFIHKKSIGKGRTIHLNNIIKQMCTDLENEIRLTIS